MTALGLQAFEGLANNRIFEGIETDLLEQIAPAVHVVQLEEGEVIFREGDPGDLLYLVGEGSVMISKSVSHVSSDSSRRQMVEQWSRFFFPFPCSTLSPNE